MARVRTALRTSHFVLRTPGPWPLAPGPQPVALAPGPSTTRAMKPSILLAAPLLLAVSAGCIIHIGSSGWSGSHGLVYSDGNPGPHMRGNGVEATEHREVSEFDAIRVSAAFDVKVSVGGEQGVILHGDENILPHVRTTVRGGSLEVTMDQGSYRFESRTWIEITVPELKAYSLAGNGDCEIAGIDQDSFSVSLSGSGDVRAVGRTDHLSVDVSGSGNLELSGLKAREANVVVTGSADLALHVSEALTVNITGSADVEYEGGPDVNATITGSGSVSVRPR